MGIFYSALAQRHPLGARWLYLANRIIGLPDRAGQVEAGTLFSL
ncbi:MAG: hypothetical protein ACRDD3_01990 [Azovibrio sp.]